MNDFPFTLYQALSADSKENLLFSPFSVQAALFRLFLGARGDTEAEMRTVLEISDSRERTARLLNEWEIRLQAAFSGTEGCTLNLANRLWVQTDYKLLLEFLQLCQSGVESVDFKRNCEAARSRINASIEQDTKGMIKDLLGSGTLDSMVRLVITNAVYFFGFWAAKFKKEDTKAEPFYPLVGHSKTVDMMHQVSRFPYYEIEKAQILVMPYLGGKVRMVVVLPKARASLLEITSEIFHLSNWMAYLESRRVEVHFPRFTMEWGPTNLIPALMTMGMKKVFSSIWADLSGIESSGELYASQVVHKAKMIVNEEGTEAAAATAIVTRSKGLVPTEKPIVFRVDHPFIHVIIDMDANPIFIGNLISP